MEFNKGNKPETNKLQINDLINDYLEEIELEESSKIIGGYRTFVDTTYPSTTTPTSTTTTSSPYPNRRVQEYYRSITTM
jgi:hypothetical protein